MRSIRWAISAAAILLSAPLGAAPSVTLVAPSPGVRYLAPASIELVADPVVDAGRSIERVEFLADGDVIGVATQAPWSFSWANVARGNYNLRARVYDSQGRRDASPVVKVHVRNNTAPKVRLTAPEHRYVAPGSVPLSATVTDRDDPIAKVEFFNGDTLLATSTAEPYTFDWTGVPTGNYELRAQATDALGAVGTSNVFRVRVRDNLAPRVRILGPENNSTFAAPATIPISLRAVDRDDNLTNAELFANGSSLAVFTGPLPYEFNWTNVAAGTYTLTAIATDDLGLVTNSKTVTITVTGIQPPAEKKLYFIHVDHLNTPRMIADELQRTVWRWDQAEPFGDSAPDENPSGLGVFEFPQRLPGQYFDRETSFHYNYSRDYDPAIGSYIQSDPIGLRGGINTYVYALSRPLNQIDVLGLNVTITYFPGGPGHIGIGVNTSTTVGLYPVLQSSSMLTCSTVPGVVLTDQHFQPFAVLAKASTLTINTQPWQDELMQQYINNLQFFASPAYNLCMDQCHTFVDAVLRAGGVARPGMPDAGTFPAGYYDALHKMYGGQQRR